MKIRFAFFLIVTINLCSCYNDKDSQRTLAIIENLKKEYKGDYRRIPLDTIDVVYISGRPFKEIENSLTNNTYCGKCNNEDSRMFPYRFYFDLKQITITFEGTCLKCEDTLTSGYVMHKRIDYLAKTLERRKHDRKFVGK